jgi:hypothetical protein
MTRERDIRHQLMPRPDRAAAESFAAYRPQRPPIALGFDVVDDLPVKVIYTLARARINLDTEALGKV